MLAINPFIDGIAFHTRINRNFIDGKLSIFDSSLSVLVTCSMLVLPIICQQKVTVNAFSGDDLFCEDQVDNYVYMKRGLPMYSLALP